MQKKHIQILTVIICILGIGLIAIGIYGYYRGGIVVKDYQWTGIYRAEINTYPDEGRYCRDSVMIEIVEANEGYRVSISGSETRGPQKGEGGVTVHQYINTEKIIKDVEGKSIRFEVSAFLNSDASNVYYVELMKASKNQINFRYADTEEQLENEKYVLLERSKY